jgi:nicotinamide-nucleotide amidase
LERVDGQRYRCKDHHSMAETLTADLPPEVEDAVARILRKACELELRLATAESCTGGLLASLLTDVDGCSHAFERGFITYTDGAKSELLGVDSALLDRHGAVSRPVALAMAEGALARSQADIAIAVTGFAGPTGGQGEEGLVHFGCARRGRTTVHREEHYGPAGRGGVRLACLRTATEMLEQALI